jgi:quinol monooxygenase YgiN
MIVVNARLVVNPERRDEFVALFKSTLGPSRAEKGCMNYRFSQDTEYENAFTVEEEWENQAALDGHWKTPHFGQVLAKLPEVLTEPLDLKVHQVSGTKGPEAVEAALK